MRHQVQGIFLAVLAEDIYGIRVQNPCKFKSRDSRFLEGFELSYSPFKN